MTATRAPLPSEIRQQAAQIIALAGELDIDVLDVANALDTCQVRLHRDQIGIPRTVADLLSPIRTGHEHRRK